jgi:hypothetical protein
MCGSAINVRFFIFILDVDMIRTSDIARIVFGGYEQAILLYPLAAI